MTNDVVMDLNISELGCVVEPKAANEKLIFDVNVMRRLFYEAYIPVLRMHIYDPFIYPLTGQKGG